MNRKKKMGSCFGREEEMKGISQGIEEGRLGRGEKGKRKEREKN
jgi:hypothetical protein